MDEGEKANIRSVDPYRVCNNCTSCFGQPTGRRMHFNWYCILHRIWIDNPGGTTCDAWEKRKMAWDNETE